MGGPYEGAAMNPARAFGPDVALGNLGTWWIYLIGPAIGAVGAVGVAYVLRGPANAGEATAAEGTPLRRGTANQERPVPASRRPSSLLVTT
jgi:aquaporin Z